MSSILPATALPASPGTPAVADASVHRFATRSRWRLLRGMLRLLAGLLLTVWGVLSIAWLALHWGILPHIEYWRGPLEKRASQALGVPVRIGRIEVRSSGWVPSFELRDVVLFDAAQRPALLLPRVFAAISPRSLLALELRFEQLLIDGAQLEVRRDANGRIFVAGLDVSGNSPDGGSDLADWFFAQREFVVRGATLRWTDEQRGAAPPDAMRGAPESVPPAAESGNAPSRPAASITLSDVQFVVRNGLRSHAVRLDASPPPEWGDRFQIIGAFTQPMLARRGDWRRWSGSAYASLPRADVQALRRHVTLPFELSRGEGALRGWVEVADGTATGATVDVALRSVVVRLAGNVEPLGIDEVQGRLTGRRDAQGASVQAQGFGFVTAAGVRWPQGDMRLAWRQRDGQPASGGEFTMQRLDIGLMAQVAAHVPLGDALRRLLAELRPQGRVDDLAATWEGALDAPLRYRIKGRLSALALAAGAPEAPGALALPGLRNAAVQLDVSESGGDARVDMSDGAIELPGVFEDPVVALDRLRAQVVWKLEPARRSGAVAPAADAAPLLTVQVKDARFGNADASGELSATWSSGAAAVRGVAGDPGRLELDARLVNGVARRVHRYLPLAIPKETRRYVENAVLGGKITSASFRVKGGLAGFPYFGPRAARNPGAAGEFRIAAQIDDAGFAFVPGAPGRPSPWPALSQASVELALEHGALELRNGRARLGGIDWSQVGGALRGLGGETVLALDATARGPLAEMLQVVDATPVGGWIGKALAATSATGNAELTLGLVLPLAQLDSATVKGSLLLAGNDVRIAPASPLLAGADGRIDFTHKGFAVRAATAKLFGGDVRFDGGTQADASVRFSGQGVLDAESLRRADELGALARLAASLHGQASYRANLGFVRGQTELTLTSNLVGMALNLPAPLQKGAEAPLALRFETRLEPAPAGAAPTLRDTVRFELGNWVQADYLRDLSGAQPRVLRGGIGVFEPAPQPAAGVAANINLKRLAVDEWEAAAERIFGAAGAAGTGGGSVSASGGAGYAPDAIGLRAQEVLAGQRRLTRLSAGLSQRDGVWRANVDADQLNGYIEYRAPSRGTDAAARVYARLARLALPKDDVEQVESLLDRQQPESLPALDIVVEDFELRGKRLGRVEVEAVNRAAGGTGRDALHDWQLSKFNITTPEAQFIASGTWAADPSIAAPSRGLRATRRAVIDFKLLLSDSGALLDRLGTRGAIRGGKGRLAGQVAWLGSPFAIDYPSLGGKLTLALDAGQFLKADPGAARLLGVLSLQALPRRLSLDFRDVFQEGFAFDSIGGDVGIARGVAQTNNLRMRGVQALVFMEGSADIARETQDLRVVVVPEINAGTAALAYAVINPAVGLGAFLASTLLRKPLMQAGTREFNVSGPWADPKVERVERKFGAALPEIDAPAAAEPEAPAAAPSGKNP